MKHLEEEDSDYELPTRSNNRMAVGGVGLFVSVGTLFNFFWGQIHENSLALADLRVQNASLTERSLRHDNEISNLFSRLATCK